MRIDSYEEGGIYYLSPIDYYGYMALPRRKNPERIDLGLISVEPDPAKVWQLATTRDSVKIKLSDQSAVKYRYRLEQVRQKMKAEAHELYPKMEHLKIRDPSQDGSLDGVVITTKERLQQYMRGQNRPFVPKLSHEELMKELLK